MNKKELKKVLKGQEDTVKKILDKYTIKEHKAGNINARCRYQYALGTFHTIRNVLKLLNKER